MLFERAKGWIALAAWIALCEGAGLVGSVFTAPSTAVWYATLAKPALNPPGWIFAPVWTILFVLMGISAFLVWQKGLKQRKIQIALGIFAGQLILNMLWSVIFFGLYSPGAAVVEIIVLWCAIVAAIVAFGRISNMAAWLLVPYIVWVSFAVYLNYAIWMLN